MEIFLFWVLLSVAAGFYAANYRGRNGFGWFLLSLLISPLLGFVFAAVSKPISEQGGNAEKDNGGGQQG